MAPAKPSVTPEVPAILILPASSVSSIPTMM